MRWYSASLRFASATRSEARERSTKNLITIATMKSGTRISSSPAPMPMR
jgi:hypothetical protein